jgi:hypothetical protein
MHGDIERPDDNQLMLILLFSFIGLVFDYIGIHRAPGISVIVR